MYWDDVSLGNFTELTTEKVKPVISEPGLIERMKKRFGKDFVFYFRGACFPKLEPGQELGTFKTGSSVWRHTVSFQKFDHSHVKPLREMYPDVTADEALMFHILLNLTFNAEEFFISLDMIPATTNMPLYMTFPENKNVTFFPVQEPGTKLEWHPTEKENQERPNLESEFFCALDLAEDTNLRLLSSFKDKWYETTPVYAFKLAENQQPASVWESAPNPWDQEAKIDERRRYYIKKNTRAAYYTTPIADANGVFCYSLVFNNDDTQHQK